MHVAIERKICVLTDWILEFIPGSTNDLDITLNFPGPHFLISKIRGFDLIYESFQKQNSTICSEHEGHPSLHGLLPSFTLWTWSGQCAYCQWKMIIGFIRFRIHTISNSPNLPSRWIQEKLKFLLLKFTFSSHLISLLPNIGSHKFSYLLKWRLIPNAPTTDLHKSRFKRDLFKCLLSSLPNSIESSTFIKLDHLWVTTLS